MLIGDKYKLEGDALNITLYEKTIIKGEHGKPSKRIGEIRWDVVGYYATTQGALMGLVQHDVIGTGLSDFQTVCRRMDELEGMIKSLPNIRPQDLSGGEK